MLTRLSWVVFLFSCYLGLWLFGGSAELAWSRMTQSCSNSRCWLLTWSWLECLKSPLCDLSMRARLWDGIFQAWKNGIYRALQTQPWKFLHCHLCCILLFRTSHKRECLSDPVVRTPHFYCWGHGFNPCPSWGTGIPQAVRCGQKKTGNSRGRKRTTSGWKGSREFVAVFHLL